MQFRFMLTLALAAATAGCGGGGAAPVTGGGPGGGTDPLASITITHPEGAVTVGDTMILQVQARDGAGQPVSGVQAQFSSSDATVATVDASGVVRGLKEGAASITATVTLGGITKTASYGVAVLAAQQQPNPPQQPAPPAATIAAFALNPATVSLVPGGTAQLDPVATDASGARVTPLPQVAWSVADATKAGVANGGVVTAIAPGSTTVSASFSAGGRTWTATASVTVTAAPASSATVQGVEDAFTPSSVTITTGGTVTWTMVDEEHDVTWTGAAPAGGNIPRIDEDESASRTFTAAGTYTYTCDRHDGEHGGTVVVNGGQEAAVFTSVRISPPGPSVAVGGTVQLTATPLDQLGRVISGLPAAQWSTSDATKATVSAGGLVTGVAAGTATVTARIAQGGTTREAAVTVTVGSGTTPTPPPPPPPPTAPSTATVTTPGESFSPATVTIRTGGTVTWTFTGGTRHNVTFNGTAPTGGNIPDTQGASVQRTFATAGTYSYTCTRHSGMNGQVVVQP
jgi:plastocyanin